MGASHSKSSLDIVNQSIIDVITENMSQCSSSLQAVQDNTVSGVDIWGRNTQNVMLTQTCTQNITISNDMIAKMADKIQQAANAKTVSLLPGYSGSQNSQKLRNYLTAKVTTKTVQKAMATLSAAQVNVVAVGGISIGHDNNQELTSVQTALQEVLNNNTVAQGITTDSNQSDSASTDTNFIAQIFDAITGTIMGYVLLVIFIIILFVVVILVYKKMSGSGAVPVEAPGPGGTPEGENPELSLGENGILLGPGNVPFLDDTGAPIYSSPEGAALDGPNGQPQMVGDRQVFVNPKGMKILSDGTPVTSEMIDQGVKVPSDAELQSMTQVGSI